MLRISCFVGGQVVFSGQLGIPLAHLTSYWRGTVVKLVHWEVATQKHSNIGLVLAYAAKTLSTLFDLLSPTLSTRPWDDISLESVVL